MKLKSWVKKVLSVIIVLGLVLTCYSIEGLFNTGNLLFVLCGGVSSFVVGFCFGVFAKYEEED